MRFVNNSTLWSCVPSSFWRVRLVIARWDNIYDEAYFYVNFSWWRVLLDFGIMAKRDSHWEIRLGKEG